MITIIGIDPGLSGTGIGLVRGEDAHVQSYSFGSIKTSAGDSIGQRLDRIYAQSLEFMMQEKPDMVVLEDIFSLEKFPGSGILLGKVTGVLLLAAFRSGASVREISVREAKKVVSGSGSADKYQVERSVRELLGHERAIRPFHASDALALALTGFYRLSKQL
ncbi:MAG: crossover junction endodeoxyribonuclease RuvC [Pseudomonadota bacterium]